MPKNKTGLIKEIVELQTRVNRALRRHSPEAWMELTLTVPQFKSLLFIVNEEQTNSRKLATALKVTPSNMTGIIDRLVEQGLVTRQENPDDRRMLMLRATGKGQDLVTSIRERATSHLSHVLADLSEEQLSVVARGLSLLADVAESHVNCRETVATG